MKVIAKRTDTPVDYETTTFLIDLEETDENGRPLGQIMSMRAKTLFPPYNIHSIIARGYWYECEVPQEDLMKLLAEVSLPPVRPPKEEPV